MPAGDYPLGYFKLDGLWVSKLCLLFWTCRVLLLFLVLLATEFDACVIVFCLVNGILLLILEMLLWFPTADAVFDKVTCLVNATFEGLYSWDMVVLGLVLDVSLD